MTDGHTLLLSAARDLPWKIVVTLMIAVILQLNFKQWLCRIRHSTRLTGKNPVQRQWRAC